MVIFYFPTLSILINCNSSVRNSHSFNFLFKSIGVHGYCDGLNVKCPPQPVFVMKPHTWSPANFALGLYETGSHITQTDLKRTILKNESDLDLLILLPKITDICHYTQLIYASISLPMELKYSELVYPGTSGCNPTLQVPSHQSPSFLVISFSDSENVALISYHTYFFSIIVNI